MIKYFLQRLCLLSLILAHCNLLHAEIYDPSASVFRFQKKMAERGDIASQFKLGLMYETGSGVEQNLQNATIWYRKAAEHNYKPAINRITYLEIKQSGFSDKHKQWLKDLKNDANFNEGEALFLLGQMYAEGTGVNKSLTRSIKLLRKATAANIPGSESEIIRVENELIELQNQYLKEEEKKAVAPIAVIPARPQASKAVTKRPAVRQAPARSKKPAPIKPARIQTVQKPAQPLTKSVTKAGLNKVDKKIKPAATVATKPGPAKIRKNPQPVPVVEEAHPMDTICSGRNRFSSGCR